jgi:hypothetical protein
MLNSFPNGALLNSFSKRGTAEFCPIWANAECVPNQPNTGERQNERHRTLVNRRKHASEQSAFWVGNGSVVRELVVVWHLSR